MKQLLVVKGTPRRIPVDQNFMVGEGPADGAVASVNPVKGPIVVDPTGENMVAVTVLDNSLRPAYRPGDVVIGERLSRRDLERAVGRDCIVATKDGRHLINIVWKGTRRGRYGLRSHNPAHQDIDNVDILSVAEAAIAASNREKAPLVISGFTLRRARYQRRGRASRTEMMCSIICAAS